MELTRTKGPAALLFFLVAVGCGPAVEPRFTGEAVDPVLAMPELAGVNWDGEPFLLSQQRGKVAIVFFGYTYCPDVCPLTLAKMRQLYAELGSRAEELAVVFVSVDPGRDTVEKLSRYVPNFDERFFGIRLNDLETTVEAYDLIVQYGQPEDGPGTDSFYYVDHTSTFFLVDGQGNLRVKHPLNANPEQLLPDVATLLTLLEEVG